MRKRDLHEQKLQDKEKKKGNLKRMLTKVQKEQTLGVEYYSDNSSLSVSHEEEKSEDVVAPVNTSWDIQEVAGSTHNVNAIGSGSPSFIRKKT